jgi:hypothetical protein
MFKPLENRIGNQEWTIERNCKLTWRTDSLIYGFNKFTYQASNALETDTIYDI